MLQAGFAMRLRQRLNKKKHSIRNGSLTAINKTTDLGHDLSPCVGRTLFHASQTALSDRSAPTIWRGQDPCCSVRRHRWFRGRLRSSLFPSHKTCNLELVKTEPASSAGSLTTTDSHRKYTHLAPCTTYWRHVHNHFIATLCVKLC